MATLTASQPVLAVFTRQVSQAEISITAWSGCNVGLYRQQILSLAPDSYLRMQPSFLVESDLGVTGGSWKWTSTPAAAVSALACDPNPAAGVSPATVLSSEGTDAVAADAVPFSYALWLKAAPGSAGVVFSSAAGLASAGPSARADRALFLRSDGTLAVAMSDGPVVSALTSSALVADSAWHFIAVTLKTTDIGNGRGLRLYVDGVLKAYDNSMRKGLAPAANESWRLGPAALNPQLGTLIPVGSFTGSVDELAVWSRTLTDSEVAGIWAARTG